MSSIHEDSTHKLKFKRKFDSEEEALEYIYEEATEYSCKEFTILVVYSHERTDSFGLC